MRENACNKHPEHATEAGFCLPQFPQLPDFTPDHVGIFEIGTTEGLVTSWNIRIRSTVPVPSKFSGDHVIFRTSSTPDIGAMGMTLFDRAHYFIEPCVVNPTTCSFVTGARTFTIGSITQTAAPPRDGLFGSAPEEFRLLSVDPIDGTGAVIGTIFNPNPGMAGLDAYCYGCPSL